MKVRLQSGKRYYYPDIMVSCESFEPKSIHKEAPVLLIEVLSKSTRSVDKREKLVAYQQLASLKEYVMIHQDRQQVEVYRRRADGRWEYEQLSIDEGLLLESLPGKPLSIPFSAIYGDYHPPTRVQEDENVSEYDFEYVDV
jgi:Uma2 family endonuclease